MELCKCVCKYAEQDKEVHDSSRWAKTMVPIKGFGEKNTTKQKFAEPK